MGAALLPDPPDPPQITDYDRAHAALYLRLLDAETAGEPWQTAAETVLEQDVSGDNDRARRLHASHMRRACWLRDSGFLHLLRD